MSEHALRFGVAGQLGYRAGSWKCWTQTGTNKRDVYVTNRVLGKTIKLSLHESGIWHIAYVSKDLFDEETRPPSRFLNSYKQPPPSNEGLTLACRIHVPHHAANIPDSQLDPSVHWLPFAPSGYSVEFAIILSERPFDPEDWPGRLSIESQAVGAIQLEGGGHLWVIHRTVPSIQGTLPPVSQPMYFKDKGEHDLLNEANRGLMWCSNDDDGSILIIESPITITKSSEI